MAEWGNAFIFGNDNLWPDLWRDGQRDFKNRWKTAAKEGRVYDLMQLVVEVLSSDRDYFHKKKKCNLLCTLFVQTLVD
jgi:hypothetical protein